jgi:hypothetical protein
MSMMTKLSMCLRGIALLLQGTQLVLAVTLVFIPESRQPEPIFWLNVLVPLTVAHVLWSTWGPGVYRTPVHKLPSSPTRPKMPMLSVAAATFGAIAMALT